MHQKHSMADVFQIFSELILCVCCVNDGSVIIQRADKYQEITQPHFFLTEPRGENRLSVLLFLRLLGKLLPSQSGWLNFLNPLSQ